MKVILIEDSGFVWRVPLTVIAENRAKYYAERDSDTTYEAEFEFVMEDGYEGLDWFQNNMDFEDVAEHAKLIVEPSLKRPRPAHWKCSLEDVDQ